MHNYTSLSDPELIDLLKAGDKLAYTHIYDRYNWLLHTHAYKKLNDREEAKDVVQGVFMTLWAKRESIELTSNLAGYLYTAIRNQILNLIAHKQVQSKYIDSIADFAEVGTVQADFQVRERELQSIIEREIALLPPKMREIFLMSRKANLTHREIALDLNLSEHTVRTQIRNALRILRVRLGILGFLVLLMNL